jgi:hypothetical protein
VTLEALLKDDEILLLKVMVLDADVPTVPTRTPELETTAIPSPMEVAPPDVTPPQTHRHQW